MPSICGGGAVGGEGGLQVSAKSLPLCVCCVCACMHVWLCAM